MVLFTVVLQHLYNVCITDCIGEITYIYMQIHPLTKSILFVIYLALHANQLWVSRVLYMYILQTGRQVIGMVKKIGICDAKK